MHLVSEKKLIYAVLALTVAFFVVLLALPVLTHKTASGSRSTVNRPIRKPHK